MAMYQDLLEQMLMNHSGLPIGRRANGYGASPLGPGGPVPAHQMNFLGGHGMGHHGMMGSPYGAGRYPYPMQPMPQLGMMSGGGISPIGQGHMPMMNPMILQYLYGGMPSYMHMMGDSDDSGFWDGDEDEEEMNPLNALLRRQRGRGRGRRRGLSPTASPGMMPGMSPAMSPFGLCGGMGMM